MASPKGRRAASAVLFLFGILAAGKALSGATVAWPPAVVWAQLSNPHRVQLCGGIALMLIAFFLTVMRQSEKPSC